MLGGSLGLAALLPACSRGQGDAPSGVDAAGDAAPAPNPIAELRPFEDELRRSFDFVTPPSAETGLGADPWAVRHVPGGWVGILRGRSALVLLDDDLREITRLPTPRSPTGLALTPNGEVLVASELSPSVARFAVRGRTLTRLGESRVPGAFGLRDVAVSPTGATWVADERGGRVMKIAANHAAATIESTLRVGHGPVQLLATARHVVVNAVTEHEILVFETDSRGALMPRDPVRIEHDGPLWGVDARETNGGLLLAAGGVENQPLDRSGGFFGRIDSFVYVYGVTRDGPTLLHGVNVADHGIITPKAVAIERASGQHIEILVTGYGSDAALRLVLDGAEITKAEPLVLVPGIRALVRDGSRLVMANPLLDAWVRLDARGVAVVPVENKTARSAASRLGEALFFTSLMAPNNTSADTRTAASLARRVTSKATSTGARTTRDASGSTPRPNRSSDSWAIGRTSRARSIQICLRSPTPSFASPAPAIPPIRFSRSIRGACLGSNT